MASGCNDAPKKNILLEPFSGPRNTPDFTAITDEDYIPAFDIAIDDARSEIDVIIKNPDIPTFTNTIEALERSGALLDAVSNIFFNLNEANTSDRMQEIALEVSPKLTALGNDISLNPLLFERVKAVYDKRSELDLNTEQARLLEKTYKGFSRSGAALSEPDKDKYRAYTEELSQLNLKFNQNVLAATNAFTINITDEKEMAGLPEFVMEAAAHEAKQKSLEGWLITLQAPSMVPFMTYSPNREIKEKLWRAYNTRSFGGEFDNSDIVKRIAGLRLMIANLLGYKTYADYALEERMAESAVNVNNFLGELLGKAVDYAREDVKAVAGYAKGQRFGSELMPWDFAYFSEKLKDEKYSVNDELTKPYLQLENVEKGIFLLANKLYGLTFSENGKIPVYHPDVKAYEVFDGDGSFLAVLYLDYFPRESKRGGAWMTEFRQQAREDGKDIRPLISLVMNFTKPTPTKPSLLTFDEFETFLHEFGHALHGILANTTYGSMSGASVYRDFVELPSQIMENWATEKEFLDLWAVHYETGEKIPGDLVRNIVNAKNYLAPYMHVRQVSYGLNDMAWHSITAPVTEPADSFERKAMEKAQVMPYIDGQCMSTSFSHIFAGGYAAGYYSYKWAEVLEADAYSLFKDKGIFNRTVALSFRDNILSKGNTRPPMELYVDFRGHEPDVKALFEKMGIK